MGLGGNGGPKWSTNKMGSGGNGGPKWSTNEEGHRSRRNLNTKGRDGVVEETVEGGLRMEVFGA